jgi:hypothetical protein
MVQLEQCMNGKIFTFTAVVIVTMVALLLVSFLQQRTNLVLAPGSIPFIP